VLYVGRDVLGRRSLLWRRGIPGLAVASVAPARSTAWTEVPTTGLWAVALSALSGPAAPQLYVWDALQPPFAPTYAPPLSVDMAADHALVCDVAIDEQDTSAGWAAAHRAGGFPWLDTATARVLVAGWGRLLDAAVRALLPGVTARHGVAVLFSGGVDCMVLAALAHRHVPLDHPIDLCTVAFGVDAAACACAPDRVTALAGHAELVAVCPGRLWRLVTIDVPPAELAAAEPLLRQLLWPSATVLDHSVGAALWFAARGPSVRARVLLSGLGADEQLGGYSRHAAAFRAAGWPGLARELRLDVRRIGERNLGTRMVAGSWERPRRY
jgi:asparagine synthetase B (glutamine-hydrolysing)